MRNADLLAQLSLFDTLAPDDLEALGERLTERRFSAGQTIFQKGEAGQSMYVIVSGSIQVFLPPQDAAQPRVVLKELKSGEYFGELSLFDDKPRSASAAATIDSVLLELTREEFGDHLGRSKKAAIAILAELADRLRETNLLLSQRAAKDVVREIEENLTWGQRLADKVADLNGSWAFIGFLVVLSLVWALFNRFSSQPFDEYPYTFFNLLLAILVALQGPLIVMSQNRQTLKDRAQAETDFRVNLKNEVGIESLLREMSAFRAETYQRLDVLERLQRNERVRAEAPKRPNEPLSG